MSNRKNYFFLNFQGMCSLPSYQEVKDSDLGKRPLILIPDNNVCTHVSQYDSTSDKIKKAKVKEFLNYCHVSNITVVPGFGILERASEPGTLKFNKDKLDDFEDEFWRKLGHYSSNNKISSEVEIFEDLKVLLYPFYAYLLMIKLILLEREPSSTNAKNNFQDLYEFTNRIGIQLVFPWQFAMAIFGGNNDLKKFISPKKRDKSKKRDTFKDLWGAAWDLFYLQLIHEHNGVRKKENNCYPQYILVTDDEACSTIGDFAKVTSGFDYGNTIYDGVMINSDFPHLSHISSFLSEMSLKMYLAVHQRAVARSSMSELDYQNHIEEIVNRAESLITELRNQIQTLEKKGFG